MDETMKKIFLLIGFLFLITLVIGACGSSADQTDMESSGDTSPAVSEVEGTPAPGDESFRLGLNEGETPLAMKLSLGSFKLEQTDYPIGEDQAGELLPLWKALRSLSESETAASEEIEAVLNQIQDTMTTEQLTAIESMELTMQDLGAIAEEMGLDIAGGFGGRFGDLTSEQQATMEAARESGQFPGRGPGGGLGFPGGGPGGGPGPEGGIPGGGEFSPEAQETAIAERGGLRGANLGVNPFILEAIIEFLESKI